VARFHERAVVVDLRDEGWGGFGAGDSVEILGENTRGGHRGNEQEREGEEGGFHRMVGFRPYTRNPPEKTAIEEVFSAKKPDLIFRGAENQRNRFISANSQALA
jgi:hypothetical protein